MEILFHFIWIEEGRCLTFSKKTCFRYFSGTYFYTLYLIISDGLDDNLYDLDDYEGTIDLGGKLLICSTDVEINFIFDDGIGIADENNIQIIKVLKGKNAPEEDGPEEIFQKRGYML